MRIAICDDERQFRDALKHLFEVYNQKRTEIVLYDEYKSGRALLKSTRQYDIIFLDYQMEELDGMETARMLRETDSLNKKAAIIFLTSYPHIVFDSFEVNPFRFLTKPAVENKLFKALDDYLQSFSESEYLIIKRPNITRILFDDIIYVEATSKTCVIHTVEESIEYAKVMAEVEKSLPTDRFFKSHKSFIVGLKHVKGRFGNDVLLDNGDKAFLASNRCTAFKEVFTDYMKKYIFEPAENG